MDAPILNVENVSKKFCKDLKRSLWYGLKDLTNEFLLIEDGRADLRRDEFWALQNVSFQLCQGETLGLIGHNGAGKTTLLRLINGLIKPDSGRITIRGRIGALIELGTGFNPILTGRENIYVNAAVLGLNRKEVDRRLDQIVDFAEIGDFIDAPVRSYSSGMKVRLGFSVAANLNPDLLLIDEILSVGDSSFRQRCIQCFREYKRNGGSIIFVSHNSRIVEAISDRVMLLERGRVVDIGEPTKITQRYEEQALKLGLQAIGQIRRNQGWSDEDDIQLTAVECYDLAGRPRSEFEFREPFEIRLQYKAMRELKSPYFVIALRKGGYEGPYAAWLSTLWDGIDMGVIPKQGMVRCLIQNPNSPPGNYCIEVGVQGQTTTALGKKWYSELRLYSEFKVSPTSSLKMRFPGIASAELISMPPIILNCNWHLNGE